MTPSLLPFALGAAASAATLAGGLAALRLHNRLGLILGLSAGIVLGVALLELVPEALEFGHGLQSPWAVALAVACGTLLYLGIRRALGFLPRRGGELGRHVGPASLTFHSFIDGCGIGVAFQLSPMAGWGVAIAILSHDIADGVNIVGLSLASHGRVVARRWLALNGAAPLLGVAVGQFVAIPPLLLVELLAGLAGIFLYIGAVELMPRSFRTSGVPRTVAAALAGFALIYLATRLHG